MEISQLPELKRCLDSVKQFRVILVDGKWYDMEGEQHTSIPEAYKLFKKYPNVEVIVSVNRHEWENRNLYLERCKDDDVLIWVDTDEWVETPIPILGEYMNNKLESDKSPMYAVSFKGKAHGAGTYRQNRLVAFPTKTRHRDRHNELWYKDNQIIKGKLPIVDLILVHHDKSFRSEERETAMRIRNKLKPFR